MQIRLEGGRKWFGKTPRLVFEIGAGVDGGGFHQFTPFGIYNTIVESVSNTREFREPDFDGEQVVVARRAAVAKAALDHRKNHPLFLQLHKRCAEVAEKFAARRFEHVEVATVVNV